MCRRVLGICYAGYCEGWEGKKELALSLDASTLGERFTVLNISVMYRGCGISIAWKIIPAMQEGEWRPYWEELLATLGWDRAAGLDGDRDGRPRTLCRLALSSDPTAGVASDAAGQRGSELSGHKEKRTSVQWACGCNDVVGGGEGKGEWSEHGERMEGTVLIRWEKGYEEKLVVVTDLGEKEGNVAWYQMRFWIEDEYKDHKSGGWGWEQTKMEDPKRAERLWLAMAVAMQMAVLVGGQEEAKEQEQERRKARKGVKGKRRVGRPPKPVRSTTRTGTELPGAGPTSDTGCSDPWGRGAREDTW